MPVLNDIGQIIGNSTTNRTWIIPFNNFDNIFQSLVVFYELTEMDGWTEVMFLVSDVVGPG